MQLSDLSAEQCVFSRTPPPSDCSTKCRDSSPTAAARPGSAGLFSPTFCLKHAIPRCRPPDRKSAALASVFLGVKSDCGLRASSLSGGRCLRTGCTKPQDTDRRADSGITPLKSQQESVDLPLPELGEITDGGSCRIKLLSWIKLPP